MSIPHMIDLSVLFTKEGIISMKILIICVSHRDGSNSLTLANAFGDAAECSENVVSYLYLKGKVIEPYTGEGVYSADDAGDEVWQVMAEHDLIVFAMPLYYYSFPAQLKALFDRCYDLPNGVLPGKRVALLATAADTAGDVFDPLVLTFQKICDYQGWDQIGSVLVAECLKPGDICGSPFLEQAKALGEGLRGD